MPTGCWRHRSPRPAIRSPIRRAKCCAILEARGASFFADLTRATGRLASEVEDALWELVAAGLVTADGFENLRALLDPKRRRGEGKGRTARPRHAPGRWALLRHTADRRPMATSRRSPGSCWPAGAWSSATPPCASRWRPPGAICWWCCAAWNRAAKSAAAAFVAAFVGEQFALPEALDLLRAIRRSGGATESAVVRPALAG